MRLPSAPFFVLSVILLVVHTTSAAEHSFQVCSAIARDVTFQKENTTASESGESISTTKTTVRYGTTNRSTNLLLRCAQFVLKAIEENRAMENSTTTRARPFRVERSAALIGGKELCGDQVVTAEDVFSLINEKVGALVIAVSENNDARGWTSAEIQKVEQFISQNEISCSVYFIPLWRLTLTNLGEFASQDNVHIALNGGNSRKEKDIVNIVGTLFGSSESTDGSQLPSIAIVASYDSFSVAPGLHSGISNGASQSAALISIAHTLKKLFSTQHGKPNRNIIFALTGGSFMNFAGIQQWADSLSVPVEYVICLDDIGTNEDLYFHVSKIPKNDTAAGMIFEALTSSALVHKVGGQTIAKKVVLRDTQLAWAHEQLAMRHLPSVTLSRVLKPIFPLEDRGSVTDRSANITSIVTTVQTVVDSLVQYLFHVDVNKHQISTSHEFVPDQMFIESIIGAFGSQIHSAPFVTTSSPLVETIQKSLSRVLSGVVVNSAEPANPNTILIGNAELTTAFIYSTKPITFDISLVGFVFSYLLIFYVVCNGFADSIKAFKNLFSPQLPKKKPT